MTIRVEVAFATADAQALLAVEVPEGATVGEAIGRSGIEARFPGVDLGALPTGIFSVPCDRGRVLAAGDRIEIYRALVNDPKDARRKRAAGKR